ncbi:AAA family ATPase [Methanobrevibacter sp. UBA313]|uniref:AAA family ATPase n=1 Tax=Methanobrevibacter sp. UBA313 TaxID=1915477 RepID=UPI0039B99598
MADIDFNLKIKNLGPHENFRFNEKVKSLKMGIYGPNAVGKTFISKIFSLVNENPKIENCNDLITLNKENCKLSFKINNENESFERNLSISIKKDQKPVIKNDTQYVFHVFNSKFVQDNIAVNNYNLDKRIDGFILGEKFIDLTENKKNLQDLESKQNNYFNKIDEEITKAKIELKSLGVHTNLKEYKLLNLDNIVSDKEVIGENYNEILEYYKQLESLPEDLKDLIIKNFIFDFNFLEDIKRILSQKFDKFSHKNKFNDKLTNNNEFIKLGMDIYDSKEKICPFCNQKLNINALELIDEFEKFVNDEESKIIEEIDNLINQLKSFENKLHLYLKEFNELNEVFNQRKLKFLNFKHQKLEFSKYEIKSVDNSIKKLNVLLSNKKKDISKKWDSSKEIIFLLNFKQDLNNNYDLNLDKINEINNVKNEKTNLKTDLRRKLCNAKYNDIKKNQKSNINNYNNLKEKILVQQNNINQLEEKNLIPRKTAVVKSLKNFLKFFFNDKYTFDEKSFSIKFQNKILEEDIENFLSEGEKNILAFCYYLSLVHTLITNEKDYEKIFFIIDDPISSLDFSHVYNVANCIKYVDNHFEHINGNKRYIVFTHNLNFMNVLIRNRITTENFYLEENTLNENTFKKINENLLLPYENHLKDIFNITIDKGEPSHTTCNSIRQILEYISSFERRNQDLKDFVQNNDILSKYGDKYILINDASHLIPGNELIDKKTLIDVCNNIIEFIESKYPGQLEGMK